MLKKNSSRNISVRQTTDHSRRKVLGAGGLLAAAVLGRSLTAKAQSGDAPPFQPDVFPDYYPLSNYSPEIPLAGKVAVIMGASRGIGLATGIALQAQGVTVIGTSRTPADYPASPFPLLELDITIPESIAAFVAGLVPLLPAGMVDILINNAGRFAVGTATPIHPALVELFESQSDLGIDTLYRGHVRVTNKLLHLMPQVGYSRLLYTVSFAAYSVGGTSIGESQIGQSFFHTYYSGKRALLAYANNMRGFLRVAGSAIKVSTVNPYAVNSSLADPKYFIWLEPVNEATGLPDNPTLQALYYAYADFLANGLPASLVGEAYVQLLSMAEPVFNVAVGSPDEPFATQGGTQLINSLVLAENDEAAFRFGAAPPG